MINTNKLKSLRVLKGLSQQKIAEILGMHYITYANKENGAKEFKVTELMKLCEILECEFNDIFMPIDHSKTNNND